MNNNFQNNFQNAQTPQIKWWLSWPFIIIVFFVFWPVSLFLIWKRSGFDKKVNLLSGNTIFILSYASLAFAFLGLLVSISEGLTSDNIIGIMFFLLSGIGLVWVGKKLKNNADKSKKYISIIANKGIIDIDNIAAAIPTSYEITKKDLQKMIDKGFFEGAYINESERQIILPKKHQANSSDQSSMTQDNARMHAVTCKCCGAQNSVAAGTVGDCEFCGSKIEI